MPTSQHQQMQDVAVGIPVFNEAEVLRAVLDDVCATFPLVIVVDDGSSDSSKDIARASEAVVLSHVLNRGQGAAIQTGLEWALRRSETSVVVTMDSDGQHACHDAVRLVDRIRLGDVDCVLGSRMLGSSGDGGATGMRRAMLRLAVRYTRFSTGLPVTDTHNGLRAFTRETASHMRLRHAEMAHASEILETLAVNRARIAEIPVSVSYSDYSRSKGQSSVNSVNIVVDLLMR